MARIACETNVKTPPGSLTPLLRIVISSRCAGVGLPSSGVVGGLGCSGAAWQGRYIRNCPSGHISQSCLHEKKCDPVIWWTPQRLFWVLAVTVTAGKVRGRRVPRLSVQLLDA